jgi:hypothetical protein
MLKVAVINTPHPDGLARTVLDGFDSYAREGKILLRLSSEFNYPLPLSSYVIPQDDFIAFATGADIIVLVSTKYATDIKCAEKIGAWHKTVFLDGSELGGNNRFDVETQARVLAGSYREKGAIDFAMLKKCIHYFRREKPYVKGITPLPFGIESRYVKEYATRVASGVKKDIDFFCVFGQDEYPLLRRFVREELIRFCNKEGFTCVTEPMGKDRFYATLARSKVGVSVGGGGFDTFRFWEILGANCLLLTETIDIFPRHVEALPYKRIRQFNNLFDFAYQLPRVGAYLRAGYDEEALAPEYERILSEHDARARAKVILDSMSSVQV